MQMASPLRAAAAAAAVATLAAAASTVAPLGLPSVARADCHTVVFDQTDAALHIRTMVVEDQSKQRSLVLLGAEDRSEPCTLRWWLDHNPQGMVTCTGASQQSEARDHRSVACRAAECTVDPNAVELGYVRTMLASAAFAPQARTMSAICIELGCRSRVRRGSVPGTLLQAAPEVRWAQRPRPSRILVIGLGSSTMALWLRRAFPESALDVAELAPGVARAAECFGLDTGDPSLHINVRDGRAFLESSSEGAYDAILVDAFDSNASLPACFRTRSFFETAKRKLAPGGALSLNLLVGRRSLRVLQSLASAFEAEGSHIWVGEAPGAQGIQNVITAFAAGHARAPPGQSVGSPPASSEPLRRAQDWFAAARYHPLDTKVLADVEAFEDKTECPMVGVHI